MRANGLSRLWERPPGPTYHAFEAPPVSQHQSAFVTLMSSRPLDAFLRLLRRNVGPNVFNPWTQRDTADRQTNGPAARLARLTAHLSTKAKRILIGEAPGYQGCRVTGIPFTSERLIIASHIPRIAPASARLSTRSRPWSEPSATIVWETLHSLGIAGDTILWNAFPWHPFKPGTPHSNRTPTSAEREQGLPVLEALLMIFPRATLLAVGRNAERSLRDIARHAIPLRHPSMGGATAFRDGLRRALGFGPATVGGGIDYFSPAGQQTPALLWQ